MKEREPIPCGRHILPSHPDYKELNKWLQALAELTNPQLFYNLKDLTFEEQLKLLDEANKNLAELMEGGAFADFIDAHIEKFNLKDGE